MTEERWYQLTFWPLIIASIVFIVAYSWQVIADLQGTAYVISRVFTVGTWTIFVVDYIVRLRLSSPRGVWFRRHIFDLLVVAIPALKPLRLLRALTVVRVLQRTVGLAVRSRIAIYGAGASIVMIWIAALAELEAERGKAGANIENFGDSIWWAFVTLTTVGYGDYYPVTTWGRTIAVLLMVGGVALVGITTATLASWIIEAATRGNDNDEPATRLQVRELADQVARLGRAQGDAPSED